MTIGYVPGGFDLFHIGHLNILEASSLCCSYLIAGVATDEALLDMKGRPPVVPLEERMAIVRSLRIVDSVVSDTSLDKRIAWHNHHFDVLFKGDDWRGTPKGFALEAQLREVGARVVYLPYTAHTSSTVLRQFLDDVRAS